MNGPRMNPALSRILLVEDEWLLATALAYQLEQQGVKEVLCVQSIEDGFSALRDSQGFDCALLDVNVGHRLVFPLADRLRQMNVPVVFVTAYPTEDFPENWRDAAIAGKPVNFAELLEKISRALVHEG